MEITRALAGKTPPFLRTIGGKLAGDTVTLSPLAPYAFAAFEVWN